MPNPCEFPDSVPWGSVREIIRLVRSGEVASNWPETLANACCIGGACANMAKQNPDGPFGFAPTSPVRTLPQVCDELETYLDDTGFGNLPVSAIINLLMELLTKLFCESMNP